MCVYYIYIIIYTVYTLIYYVNKNFYLDAINQFDSTKINKYMFKDA